MLVIDVKIKIICWVTFKGDFDRKSAGIPKLYLATKSLPRLNGLTLCNQRELQQGFHAHRLLLRTHHALPNYNAQTNADCQKCNDSNTAEKLALIHSSTSDKTSHIDN